MFIIVKTAFIFTSLYIVHIMISINSQLFKTINKTHSSFKPKIKAVSQNTVKVVFLLIVAKTDICRLQI